MRDRIEIATGVRVVRPAGRGATARARRSLFEARGLDRLGLREARGLLDRIKENEGFSTCGVKTGMQKFLPMTRRFQHLLLSFLILGLFPHAAHSAALSNTLVGALICDAKSPITDWKGTNPAVSGSVTWTPETKTISAEVWVDQAQWDSNNPLRDKHTRTMFEVERFPKAHFIISSTGVPTDNGDVALQGTLEMHGVKHAIEIPGKLQVGGGKISFQGTVSLKITEYGMKRPSLLGATVADVVKVTVQAQGKTQ